VGRGGLRGELLGGGQKAVRGGGGHEVAFRGFIRVITLKVGAAL